jgi:aryl-alcohol dehydrogenase-like predicted oxidoreductase
MRKRSLGNTGIELSELSLGTWGLSGDGYGSVEEVDQEEVIDRALKLGITCFETADCYAEGAMERRIGRLIEPYPDAIVVTKIGTDRSGTQPIKRFDTEYLLGAATGSQERLGRRIDVLLLHNPSTVAFTRHQAADTMQRLVDDGVARCWGVSMGTAEIGRVALERGAQVLELPYNAFHLQDLRGVLVLARVKQAGLIGRSVLAHGLLCGQWPSSKQFPRGDHRRDRWTPDDLRQRLSQLSALRPAVVADVTSLRAAALRFALSEPAFSSIVLGPRNALQLDQLVRDAGKEPPYLDDDARGAILNRLANVGISP